MTDLQKNQMVLKWIWNRMHQSDLKMPRDQLIFEGEHDLIYLYQTGFVDSDKYSMQEWLNAFRTHRQKDGRYLLSLEYWLDKAKYRYAGQVGSPFNPDELRNGTWTIEDFRAIIREKIVPETVIPYELFYRQIETILQAGLLPDKTFIMDQSMKEVLRQLLDQHASPRRRRELSVQQVRQTEELESPEKPRVPPIGTQKPAKASPHAKSGFSSSPDQQKKDIGKLSNLLSGSKK